MRITMMNMALPGNCHTTPGEIIEGTEKQCFDLETAYRVMEDSVRSGGYYVTTITDIEDDSKERFQRDIKDIARELSLSNPDVRKINGVWKYEYTFDTGKVSGVFRANEKYGNKYE